MATLRLRKAPTNPAAGAGWLMAAIFALFFGIFVVLIASSRKEDPAVLPAGLLLTVFGVMCAVLGVRSRLRSLGPYQFEVDSDEFRDLSSGDRIRWADVDSIQQTRSGDVDILEIRQHGQIQMVEISGLNHPVELIATTATDLHRKSQGKVSFATELHQAGATICCPVCGKESDSVKCYQYMSMLFAFVAYGYQTTPQIGCPSCTRKMIGKNLLINLLTANLVWPFICLPWSVVLLIMSTTRGHSASVLKSMAAEAIASGNESQ